LVVDMTEKKTWFITGAGVRSPDAQAAVRAAVDRFGRIDVLVNNAATAGVS
jgi:NAD(P)-dependent dehydrogenase (short-subunit alcohol dehydrogenase family)